MGRDLARLSAHTPSQPCRRCRASQGCGPQASASPNPFGGECRVAGRQSRAGAATAARQRRLERLGRRQRAARAPSLAAASPPPLSPPLPLARRLVPTCSTEEDRVFENALAQFWEHSDKCVGWETAAAAAAVCSLLAARVSRPPPLTAPLSPRPPTFALAGWRSARRCCPARTWRPSSGATTSWRWVLGPVFAVGAGPLGGRRRCSQLVPPSRLLPVGAQPALPSVCFFLATGGPQGH